MAENASTAKNTKLYALDYAQLQQKWLLTMNH